MSFLRWLTVTLATHYRMGRGRRCRAARRHQACLSVTRLEDRLAPAVLTVNSLADGPISAASSTLTLRDAVALVDSGGTATDSSGNSLAAAKAGQIDLVSPFGANDTIQFAPNLLTSAQQRIVLQDGSLLLDENARIIGPAASELAVSGDNRSTVFEIAASADVGISSLTIEEGAASGNAAGGIVNNGALTLTDAVVTDNSAVLGNGGGIANRGTLTLVDSDVSGNTARNDAGILNTGALTLTDSSVSGNVSVAANGGIGSYGGALTLIDSSVSGNTALVAGGIGNYDGGTATLVNSSVSDNSALGAGGIFNTATLTLSDSTVSGNAATNDAGILNIAALTLTESTVSGNTAAVGNGGIGNYGGSLMLVDSSVSGNLATGAGGIGNYDGGTTTLLNSNVSGNSASFGGGILNSATLTLTDSTASANSARNDDGILNTANLTLTDSSVSGNTAVAANGGIGNYGGALTLVDSSVSGNSGGGNEGGGMAMMPSSAPAGDSAGLAGRAFDRAWPTPTESAGSANTALIDAGNLNDAERTTTQSAGADSTLANDGDSVSLSADSDNARSLDGRDAVQLIDNDASEGPAHDSYVLSDSIGAWNGNVVTNAPTAGDAGSSTAADGDAG
jgi:hypothetical protein